MDNHNISFEKIKYRLEFSEKQQCFHMEINSTENENTNGYITVLNPCTNRQKNIFKAFLYRNEKNGLNGERKIKYKEVDVLKDAEELRGFLSNLEELNFDIKLCLQ